MNDLQLLIAKTIILFIHVLKSNQHNKRQYYSQYLSYGSTNIGDDTDTDFACIFCHTLLASRSMAPA